MSEQSSSTDVWGAAALLAIATPLDITQAEQAIRTRAGHLGVHPDDIAAYIEWNGSLPD